MKKPLSERFIKLTGAEIYSGLDRVRWAEGLIQQLPCAHRGRNSWLLNYGVGDEATALRAKRGITLDPHTRAVQPLQLVQLDPLPICPQKDQDDVRFD
ncbi:MAG: hypothetical protein V3R83_12300 [Gammaproteobacteria bacterium]